MGNFCTFSKDKCGTHQHLQMSQEYNPKHVQAAWEWGQDLGRISLEG